MTASIDERPERASSDRSGQGPKAGRVNRFASVLPLCCLVVTILFAYGGCKRHLYRTWADRDAYRLISEKANHPHWQLQNYAIDIDPRSRMFDPFDPDYEPMPPDDPASHQLMHCVDGKKGYPHWHANGDTPYVQNPDWMAYLPLNEEGVLVLDAETAFELALMHSRDYQEQLEELYLSALDVSFERFRFDAQFFGGYLVDYNTGGPLSSSRRSDGIDSGSSSTLELATFPSTRDGIGLTRQFTTGSELIVGFANSLIWEFSGPDNYRPVSALNFAFLQPLLREAGRDRVMETLTLSERTLLANVRQMERWRRGFFVEILTGRNAGAGPSRRGGVFGAGLQGFSGLGSGGFGGISTGGGGGGIAGATSGTGGGQAGGFMGLLQTRQEIDNQEDNLAALQSNQFRLLVTLQELLTTIPENSEAVVRQRLQVAQNRQAVLNAESRLVNARASYQDQLDAFKITLGLPPQLCVRVKDPMLERVNLMDPQVRSIQDSVAELQQQVGDAILGILPDDDRQQLSWSPELAVKLQQLGGHLDDVEPIRRVLMDGENAQIQRVREDGIKLGRKLQGLLEESVSADNASAEDRPLDPVVREDLQLVERVLAIISDDDDWLDRLSGFNQLRDAVSDLDRLQLELVKEDVLDVEWMRTDSNPRTRQLYLQYRDAVAALADLPPEQRPLAVRDLAAQLDQDVRPLQESIDAILAENPWLAELDRWRISPDEAESVEMDDRRVQIQRLKRLFVQFVDTLINAPARFDSLPGKVADFQAKIDALVQDGPNLSPEELISRFRQDISPAIPQELVDLGNNVLELSLVQARDRAETVSLVQVDLHPAAALEIARQNRRDWMNARASLVDAWRLIEFVADDLESTLDLEINGEMKNTGDNPFNFDADTGRLNARIRFDAPLNRFSERNAYRQKLIEYQQARRNYYALEDQIARGLRNTIRTLQASRRNFEIRREAVRAADLQIELNEDIRLIQEANRQPSGPTAARDAVSALSDLLTAQNDFLSVWVTYEVLRRTLDFDLGTMQLDTRGMWIDPGTIGPETGYPGIADENADCWPGAMTSPEVQPQCAPCEMIEPGMIEPGMIEPGMIEPGMIEPGMIEPGMIEPGMIGPGMIEPGMIEPGMIEPGMIGPGMIGPGMIEPGMIEPGMIEPGRMGLFNDF